MRVARALSWSLVLATAGCAASSPSPSIAPSAYPTSVQVSGHALPLVCQGSGSPTIVLEAGTDDPIDFIEPLQARLAEDHLTCTYERAAASAPRTAADLNDDLQALLDAAGLPAPYVLVGQSVGGELVQLYARTHPNDVVGVVAMNSGPPCGPWLEALAGLGNPPLLEDETAICADNGAARDRLDLNASWAEELAAAAPPDIPFELVISTADGDWCPPDSPTPEPFASRDQCLEAWAIHEAIARDIVAAWPMGHFSTLDGPHPLWRGQLDALSSLILGVVDQASGPGE